MKKHIRVEDKLLQTNKKYSSLKLKQKEHIHSWMYEAYKKKYQELKKYPDTKYDAEILEYVYEKIEEADIWIPYGEVVKRYKSVRSNLRKRLTRELQKNDPELQITLEILSLVFTVYDAFVSGDKISSPETPDLNLFVPVLHLICP